MLSIELPPRIVYESFKELGLVLHVFQPPDRDCELFKEKRRIGRCHDSLKQDAGHPGT
jgi:hypothetical protein